MKKIQHNFLRNRCRWYNFKQFDKADPNSSHIYYQQWNASIHTQIWMTAHFIVLHKRWQNENEKFRLQTDMRCQWNLICSNICILDPIKLSRKVDLCDSKFNLAHFFLAGCKTEFWFSIRQMKIVEFMEKFMEISTDFGADTANLLRFYCCDSIAEHCLCCLCYFHCLCITGWMFYASFDFRI